MRPSLVVAGALLSLAFAGCDDSERIDPRSYKEFMETDRQSTHCGAFDVTGIGVNSNVQLRKNICRSDGLRREDYISPDGTNSEFQLSQDLLVRCTWPGMPDTDFTPIPQGKAECFDYSDVLDRDNAFDPYAGWTREPNREIVGSPTTCFMREVDPDTVDESCFTDEGWLALESRETKDGGSIQLATKLTDEVPPGIFTLPVAADSRTGLPLLSEDQ